MSVVDSVFSRYGLPINHKAGKTEAIVCLFGPGAKAQRVGIAERGYNIPFSSLNGSVSVRVVEYYRHIDAICEKHGFHKGIRARCGHASSALEGLRSVVFKSHQVSEDTKVRLVRSLIHSRLFYNSMLWSGLSRTDIRKLSASYVKVFRYVLGKHNRADNAQRTTDKHILDSVDVPDALVVVRSHRLRYLRRLILSDQEDLRLQIVLSSGRNDSWMAAIFEDISWMIQTLPQIWDSMPNPQHDFAAWITLIKSRGWLALISKATSASVQLRKQGPVLAQSPDAPDVLAVDNGGYVCYHCGRAFDTRLDMVNHAHRSHDYVSPTRLFCPGMQCLHCLTLFGSRYAVIQHLQNRKGCLAAIQEVYAPLPIYVVKEQDAKAVKVAKLNIPLYPAMKCRGPRISHELASGGLRVLTLADTDVTIASR